MSNLANLEDVSLFEQTWVPLLSSHTACLLQTNFPFPSLCVSPRGLPSLFSQLLIAATIVGVEVDVL